MKTILIGLFSVIPVFATSAACVSTALVSVGCQSVDSNFVNVSSTSLASSPEVGVPAAPAPVVSTFFTPSPVTIAEPTVASFVISEPTVSNFVYQAAPVVIASNTFSGIIPQAQMSLSGSLIVEEGFNFDPASDVPEAGSIAMIGSGLIFLSLAANSARKKAK